MSADTLAEPPDVVVRSPARATWPGPAWEERRMRCPWCGHADDKVIDSRTAEDGAAVRRRRECLRCGRRFTTFERAVEVGLSVVKRDGAREPFDRAKIVAGVAKAIKNRPV